MNLTTTQPRRIFINAFFLALGYGVCFFLLLLALQQRDIVFVLPDYGELPFDVGWYYSVITRGYEYNDNAAANSAFFPLFPLMWKISHLGPWGISVVNLLLFSSGFAIFCAMFNIDSTTRFIWLTIPSIYIVWVPYAESLYIFFTVVAFYGIVKKRRWLIWIGLFFGSLSRPTVMVMTPALLIMELITNQKKNILFALKEFFISYAVPLLAGLALFIWYQYYSTGVWFAFFKQEVQWGHEFAWTTFPLNSMYGPKLLWLDAVALFIGFVCLLLLIGYGLKWLLRDVIQQDKLLVLSCLYITGVCLTTLLFNPIWGTYTTNVYDIHRYVLVSPFLWVLFHRFITNSKGYKPMHYIGILLLTNVFWLTFAHYQHIRYVLYFNFASVYIIMYLMLSDKRIKWMPLAIAGINVLVQVQMIQWFFSKIYPG